MEGSQRLLNSDERLLNCLRFTIIHHVWQFSTDSISSITMRQASRTARSKLNRPTLNT